MALPVAADLQPQRNQRAERPGAGAFRTKTEYGTVVLPGESENPPLIGSGDLRFLSARCDFKRFRRLSLRPGACGTGSPEIGRDGGHINNKQAKSAGAEKHLGTAKCPAV